MDDSTVHATPKAKSDQSGWFIGVLLWPKKTFSQICAQPKAVWFAPLLLLSVLALVHVLVSGSIKREAALSGQVQLPPDFQYYDPVRQEQFMQAAQAASGPAFIYVLPAVVALAKVWLSWLVVGSIIHLVLTSLGGRSQSRTTLNLTAWAAMPFALRDLVRIIAIIATQRLIQSPGLSGFAPQSGGRLTLYIGAFLALIDLYAIWNIILLAIGAAIASKLPARKAFIGVGFTMLVILALQALIGFGISLLTSSMTATQPFF